MLEKFIEVTDRGNEFGALLTDLLKASDCTDCELPILKPYWYGLSLEAVKGISYLKNRTQRKIKLLL